MFFLETNCLNNHNLSIINKINYGKITTIMRISFQDKKIIKKNSWIKLSSIRIIRFKKSFVS